MKKNSPNNSKMAECYSMFVLNSVLNSFKHTKNLNFGGFLQIQMLPVEAFHH